MLRGFLKGILSPWRHLHYWSTKGRAVWMSQNVYLSASVFFSQVFVCLGCQGDRNPRLQGSCWHAYQRLDWVRSAVYDSYWSQSPWLAKFLGIHLSISANEQITQPGDLGLVIITEHCTFIVWIFWVFENQRHRKQKRIFQMLTSESSTLKRNWERFKKQTFTIQETKSAG